VSPPEPLQGSRDHISHRLVRLRLPVWGAVSTIYAVAASLGVAALVVSQVNEASGYLLGGLVAVLGALAAAALSRVHTYDRPLATGEETIDS
jgi:hypothetical protein